MMVDRERTSGIQPEGCRPKSTGGPIYMLATWGLSDMTYFKTGQAGCLVNFELGMQALLFCVCISIYAESVLINSLGSLHDTK